MGYKRWLTRVTTVGVLICAAVFSAVIPASSNHVTPTTVSGNPTCKELMDDPAAIELRIQPVADGTYTLNGFSVTIDVRDTLQGQVFDFTSNTPVDTVFVKGGPGGNLYTYDPPATTDTGLHAPLNLSNGRWYGLSHLSFCFVPRPGTALALSSSSPAASNSTITVHSGDTVTLTFAETNNGNQNLTGANVTANNGCTPEFLSGDDGDGILEPGETWLFRCTITNVTGDTTITAIGHGTDTQGRDVTWCQDPANPPANTFCDQDERVQVPIDVINPSTALSLQSSSPAASGGTVTVDEGGSVTLTFAEANTGDVPLTSPTVTADNGCTPGLDSGDTNLDGVLDTDETWVFSCTITNVTTSRTITAIGSGVDPLGSTVTWCADANNPPANTVCSQNERVQVPIVVTPEEPPPPPPGAEGCTPGFWRNHPELWDGSGSDDVTTTIQTTDLFNATFGVTTLQSGLLPTVTLLDAVNLGGGGKQALARHAAAALASADSGIDYPFTVQEVIDLYRDAVGAEDGPETVASALATLSAANEAGCPF